MIAFEWDGPIVIVSGTDAFGRTEALGIGLESSDILNRPYVEKDIAVRLGIVTLPDTANWEPEEL